MEGVKEKEYVIDLIFLSSIAICVHTSPISANNPVLDGYPPVLRGFVGGIKWTSSARTRANSMDTQRKEVIQQDNSASTSSNL